MQKIYYVLTNEKGTIISIIAVIAKGEFMAPKLTAALEQHYDADGKQFTLGELAEVGFDGEMKLTVNLRVEEEDYNYEETITLTPAPLF